MRDNGGFWSTLARWLARGSEEEPYRPPQKRTWAEKLTDDGNAWLAARRLELDGNLDGAAHSYAQDAEIWRQRGQLARAALSAACQARCLAGLGVDGAAGYERAAGLYLEAGRRAVAASPHDAIHLLERATECYGLAGNGGNHEAAALLDALRSVLDGAADR